MATWCCKKRTKCCLIYGVNSSPEQGVALRTVVVVTVAVAVGGVEVGRMRLTADGPGRLATFTT